MRGVPIEPLRPRPDPLRAADAKPATLQETLPPMAENIDGYGSCIGVRRTAVSPQSHHQGYERWALHSSSTAHS